MQKNARLEVMSELEPGVEKTIKNFLISPDEIWQPADLLPDSQSNNFLEEVKEIRELSKELDDDFWVALVGDTITEEALPTYESWLLGVEGMDVTNGGNNWAKWIKQWTGEEKRHGDILNKMLYLSGR
ncbi:unnamed protein product, partial [Cyprideis torosa]